MSNTTQMIKRPPIYWPLLPFAVIYGGIVGLRNKFFDWGILKSEQFNIPSICIGNISVGGTGKTPHTEYLIRLLQNDWKVAVLSRGYKRKSKGFRLANKNSTLEDIGDEPLQMHNKFGNIIVAVDRDRKNGILQLSQRPQRPDVILLDDAFQHRYVKAGLSILLIDCHRPIHYDCILPAGRLRENARGQKRADIIIVTKCDGSMDEQKRDAFRTLIRPLPTQRLFFSKFVYGDLYAMTKPAKKLPLTQISSNMHILLLTGIATPAPIIKELGKRSANITNVPFADHHDFTPSDIKRIKQDFEKLPGNRRIIVTTEKDASRLKDNMMIDSDLKENIYVLPIIVDFLDNEKAEFDAIINKYMSESKKKI